MDLISRPFLKTRPDLLPDLSAPTPLLARTIMFILFLLVVYVARTLAVYYVDDRNSTIILYSGPWGWQVDSTNSEVGTTL